jgi:hypothetical protein
MVRSCSRPCGEATKVHAIAFGKWIQVQWLQATETKDKPLTGKVRTLPVDTRVKQCVLGTQHGGSK